MSINYDKERIDLTRRNFLSLGTWGLFAIGNLGLLGFFGRFFVPNVKYGPPSKFDIGKASSYPDGAQQTFIDQKVSIIRHGSNIGAISLVCQHLGCTVAPSATGYDCPCHGSKYDAMGQVTHGPAQIGLFWFQISLTPSGDLQVDKSNIVPMATYYKA
jgi:cytochrome b6-f complex iron-sulfur subunit